MFQKKYRNIITSSKPQQSQKDRGKKEDLVEFFALIPF